MYCKFFGFSQKPFDVTPDPEFLYLSPGHREMLATLIYGVRQRRGFIAVVGEVGTGKTTLLNALLAQLDGKTSVAYIFNTTVSFDEMLSMTLVDLGLAKPKDSLTRLEVISRLKDFAIRQLSRGGNVVLLVDEAQNLDRSAMENLRLLSNLETPKHKLIQIVLSGQPELDLKLSQPELRQLNQRIAFKRYITPLKKKETNEYIQHRLRIAAYSGPSLFTPQARRMIWEYSGGVPRKINILCDNALLITYALRQKTIKARVIKEAIKDLNWSPFSDPGDALGAVTSSGDSPITREEHPVSAVHGNEPDGRHLSHASRGTLGKDIPERPTGEQMDLRVSQDVGHAAELAGRFLGVGRVLDQIMAGFVTKLLERK